MDCPFCGSTQVMVVNSRPTIGNSQIWRRRECLSCKGIFTTYERINLSHLIVVKKSGRKQRYSRAKLFSGIYHSSLDKKGADRGQLSQSAEELTNQVERELINLRTKRVTTDEIMEVVLKVLSKKAPDILLRYVAYKESSHAKKIRKLIKKYL